MQELINEYKNHNVVFLFINTWERGGQDQIKDKVSEFIKDENYSFNVLYDFDKTISDKYFIKGIPSKIVIDKNGQIISANSSDSNLKALIEENK
jgi:formyltetrahydrofolate synthetase